MSTLRAILNRDKKRRVSYSLPENLIKRIERVAQQKNAKYISSVVEAAIRDGLDVWEREERNIKKHRRGS